MNGSESGEISTVAHSEQETWQGYVKLASVFVVVYIAASAALIWVFRWNVSFMVMVAQMIWILTLTGLTWHRRIRSQVRPADERTPWYRFTLVELFVLVTGLSFFLGLTAADHRADLQKYQAQEELRESTAEVLGPDGWLSFDSNGALRISICDRTFDDRRLHELQSAIKDYTNRYPMVSLLFGTGAIAAGTPAKWPAVTDLSVDVILEWSELEFLEIEGTNISGAGRQRLRKLPDLQDISRKRL